MCCAGREAAAADTKQRLQQLLPAFTPEGAAPARAGTTDADLSHGLREELKFKWIVAADHFVCSDSHCRPLAAPELRGLQQATMEHLHWKFSQWFADRQILAEAVAPLLRQIAADLEAAAAAAVADPGGPVAGRSRSQGQGPALSVYSGHDVSILGVHYAMSTSRVGDLGWWPGYSSSASFELIEYDVAPGEFHVRTVLRDAAGSAAVGSGATATTGPTSTGGGDSEDSGSGSGTGGGGGDGLEATQSQSLEVQSPIPLQAFLSKVHAL
jgi:hypothetical protein